MEESLQQQIEKKLAPDLVPNLMALKFLRLLGDQSIGRLVQGGESWATLIAYPPRAFYFDAAAYPTAPWIVYLNGNRLDLVASLAGDLEVGSIVKVSSEPALSHFQAMLPNCRSFLWYSTRELPRSTWPVAEQTGMPTDIAEVYREFALRPGDLEDFQTRATRWFVLGDSEGTRGVSYIQQNYRQVWEISGVAVPPRHRGKGYAKAVTLAAAKFILDQGNMVRYFVQSDNAPSIGVAKSLGFDLVAKTQHFRIQEQ